jgi:WD40 repeat protein
MVRTYPSDGLRRKAATVRRIHGFPVIFAVSLALFGQRAFAAGSGETAASVVINTGHKGAVLVMEYDENSRALFTGGEDGMVRVWDLTARRLVRSLRISHDAVSMLSVRPDSSQFAVLVAEDPRARFLSVWDWKDGRELFRTPLADEPLFLRYSAAGNYIVAGLSQWNGLKIFRSTDGSLFSFHPEGFGIVSFAEISRTEKTIMTYQPGGRITYWDMGTGAVIKEIKGVSQLSKPAITRDRMYLFGLSGREILLVDIVTGAVKTRIPADSLISADVSYFGDEIAWITAAGAVSLMGLTNDPPVLRTTPAPEASLVRFAGGELFVSGPGGDIHSVSEGDDFRLLAKNELADVTGMAFGSSGLALASDRWIWLFRSGMELGTAIRQPVLVGNPLAAPAGLSSLDDGRLLVWSKAGEKGEYGILDVETGAFTPGFSKFTGPLLQAVVQDGRLLTLEKGGMARILDLTSGSLQFSFWFPGAVQICMVSPTRLIAGRSTSGGNEGSILSVDITTGETVAFRGRSVYTYEFAFDKSSNTLYSIGVDGKGETNLLANSGSQLGVEARIMGYPGEDLSATLAFDAVKGRLYSSLGFDHITAAAGSSIFSLPPLDQTPRKLAVSGGMIGVLNKESSISVLDLSTGKTAFSVYVFEDGGWCIAFPGGTYAAAESSAGLVTVSSNGELVLDEAYRLTLP